MTNDGKPIYCWDASVFLAWINEVPLASRREPIVEAQTWNHLEVGGVVGDQREIMHKRHRGNHQIRRWNGNPSLEKAAPNFAKLLGAGDVEIHHLHIGQQVGNSLQQRCRIRNMVSAGLKFAENHRGNE